MATTGLVLGWAAIGLFALLVVVAVLASVAMPRGGGPAGGLRGTNATAARPTRTWGTRRPGRT